MGGDGREALPALGADGGAGAEGSPGSALRCIESPGLDPLAQCDVLFRQNLIEGGRPRQLESERRRSDAIVAGPVGVRGGVQQVGRRVGRGLAAAVIGGRGGATGQVGCEGRVQGAAQAVEAFGIDLVDPSASVRRQVQQQVGAAANGPVVDVDEILQRAYLRVLMGISSAGDRGYFARGSQKGTERLPALSLALQRSQA